MSESGQNDPSGLGPTLPPVDPTPVTFPTLPPVDPTPVTFPHLPPVDPTPVTFPHLPPVDPTPVTFPDNGNEGSLGGDEWVTEMSFVVLWDERVPLTTESRNRIERQLRKMVLTELGELEVHHDVAIMAVDEPRTRGIRIRRLSSS